MNSTPDRRRYESMLEQMRTERSSYLAHWRDLSRFISPRSARFSSSDNRDGRRKGNDILNGTATVAMRTLVSGIMAGLTSPARPWFRLTLADPELAEAADVRVWLSDVERRMRDVLNRSNLYNALPILYHSLGCYGSGAMIVLEDAEDTIRCYPMATGTFLMANGPRGDVDVLAREYQMTVRQLVDTFGMDACSEQVRTAYKNGTWQQYIDIIHLIAPNQGGKPGYVADKKPWVSLYWEAGSDGGRYLRVSGFDSRPFVAPRWTLYGDDVYGESPAMHVLGDVRQLQLEERRKLQALEKAVDPPMVGDIALKSQRVQTAPGSITYVDNLGDGRPGLRPVYEVSPRIAEISADIQGLEYRIKTGLYEHLFLMIAQQDKQMTAREVAERHQEKLLALGPVLERLNDELLDPLIDRVFDIMLRGNWIPEPPDSIKGADLNVEYISVMAQAQKAVAVSGIEQLYGFVGNLAAGRPDVLDKLDFDKTLDEYADLVGVTPRILVSNDQVKATREQRAQMQQVQQMAAMMPVAQQTAETARVLSETDAGGGSSMLQQLLSGAAS